MIDFQNYLTIIFLSLERRFLSNNRSIEIILRRKETLNKSSNCENTSMFFLSDHTKDKSIISK